MRFYFISLISATLAVTTSGWGGVSGLKSSTTTAKKERLFQRVGKFDPNTSLIPQYIQPNIYNLSDYMAILINNLSKRHELNEVSPTHLENILYYLTYVYRQRNAVIPYEKTEIMRLKKRLKTAIEQILDQFRIWGQLPEIVLPGGTSKDLKPLDSITDSSAIQISRASENRGSSVPSPPPLIPKDWKARKEDPYTHLPPPHASAGAPSPPEFQAPLTKAQHELLLRGRRLDTLLNRSKISIQRFSLEDLKALNAYRTHPELVGDARVGRYTELARLEDRTQVLLKELKGLSGKDRKEALKKIEDLRAEKDKIAFEAHKKYLADEKEKQNYKAPSYPAQFDTARDSKDRRDSMQGATDAEWEASAREEEPSNPSNPVAHVDRIDLAAATIQRAFRKQARIKRFQTLVDGIIQIQRAAHKKDEKIIETLKSGAVTKDSQIKELTQRLKAANTRSSDYNQKIEQLQKKLASLTSKSTSLEQKMAEQLKAFSLSSKKAPSSPISKEMRTQETQTDLQVSEVQVALTVSSQQALNAAEEEKEQLKEVLGALQAENRELREERTGAEDREDRRNQELETLKKTLQEAKNALNQKKAEVQSLTKLNEEMKEALRKQDQELINQTKAIEEKDKVIHEKIEAIKRYMDENEKLNRSIQTRDEKERKRAQKLEEIEQQLRREVEQVQQLTEQKKSYDREIAELRKAQQELSQQLESHEGNQAEFEQALRQKETNYNQKVAELAQNTEGHIAKLEGAFLTLQQPLKKLLVLEQEIQSSGEQGTLAKHVQALAQELKALMESASSG